MVKLLQLTKVGPLIDIPTRRLRTMVREGAFPAVRIRGRIFVTEEQLAEFIDGHKVNAAWHKEGAGNGSTKADKREAKTKNQAEKTPAAKNQARRTSGRARQRA